MNLSKWKDWRLKALQEQEYYSDAEINSSYEDFEITDFKVNSTKKSGTIEIDFKDRNTSFDSWIVYPDGNVAFEHWYPDEVYKKLSEFVKSSINNKTNLNESFHHLTSEAKLGLYTRQLNKSLKEIESQLSKILESDNVSDKLVEAWVKTYKSLKSLDERIHTIMKKIHSR